MESTPGTRGNAYVRLVLLINPALTVISFMTAIHFIADDQGAFVRSLGLAFDATPLLGGLRSKVSAHSTEHAAFQELIQMHVPTALRRHNRGQQGRGCVRGDRATQRDCHQRRVDPSVSLDSEPGHLSVLDRCVLMYYFVIIAITRQTMSFTEGSLREFDRYSLVSDMPYETPQN